MPDDGSTALASPFSVFERIRDGWRNLYNQLGVVGRDRMANATFAPNRDRDPIYWDQLYRDDAMAARYIDLPAERVTRRGWSVGIKDTDEGAELSEGDAAQSAAERAKQAEDMGKYGKRLDLKNKTKWGLTRGWVLGGAVTVNGADDFGLTDDLQNMSTPLVETAIKSIRWILIYDRTHVQPGDVDTDASGPNFGRPLMHRITPTDGTSFFEVHWTRVHRFKGVEVPEHKRSEMGGWDDSKLRRVSDALQQWNMSYKAALTILGESSQGVYKMKNLAGLIAAGREEEVRLRLQIIEEARGLINAALLDAEHEDFVYVSRSLRSIHETLARLEKMLSASMGIPMTLLMQVSPGGFGTGDHETRNYDDSTEDIQESEVEPFLRKVYRLISLAKDGPTGGKEVDIEIRFDPLRTPTVKESAEIRERWSKFASTMIDAGVLNPDEVAASAFGGDGGFSIDIELDEEERERRRNEEPDDPGEDVRADENMMALLASTRGGSQRGVEGGG